MDAYNSGGNRADLSVRPKFKREIRYHESFRIDSER